MMMRVCQLCMSVRATKSIYLCCHNLCCHCFIKQDLFRITIKLTLLSGGVQRNVCSRK